MQGVQNRAGMNISRTVEEKKIPKKGRRIQREEECKEEEEEDGEGEEEDGEGEEGKFHAF